MSEDGKGELDDPTSLVRLLEEHERRVRDEMRARFAELIVKSMMEKGLKPLVPLKDVAVEVVYWKRSV